MTNANIIFILIIKQVTSKAFLTFSHDYCLIFHSSIKIGVLNPGYMTSIYILSRKKTVAFIKI